jgi:IclR family transcriptional regulator, acetate operon repressor
MINSINKAFDILDLFSPLEPRLSLSEISKRLGLPKSTVYNLLATLVARGVLEKVDHEYYAMGTAIIDLTRSVRVNVELRDRAAPMLRKLADISHLSVYLTTLDKGECLYIYAIETSRRLLARTAVGDRVPLHCTSVGKVIIAHLPEEEAHEIVSRGLERFTAATITDPDNLYSVLKEICSQGFAIDNSEHEDGIYCVGAPIFNSQGQVIGACSISGTDPSILDDALKDLSSLVMTTAQEISRRMGFVSSSPTKILSMPVTELVFRES